ncbi:MAG: subclass B3 metallo-beta-lactamase [Sphingomonas sp.]|uniref:subclass B3 metallo-beta-lactamase n=1 Tax=Sphingomonas sp. TaxID=28214 RepID=UPI003F7FAFB4
MIARMLAAAVAAILLAVPAAADNPAAWTQPTAPFRIAGNIYYVGTRGLASYLIVTPKGLILLDATMEANVPAIEKNIRALGFKVRDVKILLNSHAHFDHAGGLAAMKRDTGAELDAMDGDVWALENGKHFGDQNYVGTFPAVKVDRRLKDGDRVTLGGVTMTAILTAGHTRGCTTWTTTVRLKAGAKAVVFPCSLSVAGNKLYGNKAYPGIVGDYRASFKRMAAINADIVLPAHPEIADVMGRHASGKWLAPDLLPKIVAEAQTDFEREMMKQQAIAK